MMVSSHITRWCHSTFVHIAIILVVGSIVYSGIISAPFVYDDFQCIVLNPALHNFNFVTDMTTLKNMSLSEDIHKNIVLRPVAYLSFAVNYNLHGYDVVGYHLFNIAVHFLNALFVYLIVRLTLGIHSLSLDKSAGPVLTSTTRLIPLFTAIIFVSHPLQTQSVTYITQRFASLAALFFILSLALYIKSGLTKDGFRRALYYTGSLIAACTAMKTKEIAFTLPLMIIIYECTFFRNTLKRRIVTLAPFMLTMLIIPITAIKLEALFSHAAGSTVGQSMNLVNYNAVSRWDYLLSQFLVVVTYIRLLFVPVNQHLDYNFPLYKSFFQLSVVLSFCLIISLLSIGIYLYYRSKTVDEPLRTRLRLVAFGITWFFVTLSVESSIIPLDDLLVEQRVYLPSFGFILAVVTSVAILFESRKRVSVIMFAALFCLVTILLSITAYKRNTLWIDPIELWLDTAHKSPRSARAYQNLGAHYFSKMKFKECMSAFSTAQRLEPGKIEPTFNLANVYLALNRFDRAESEYMKVLNDHPDDGRIYIKLAHTYILQNKQSEAMTLLRQALLVIPSSIEIRTKLAELYEAMGQSEQAVAEYVNILKYAPESSVALDRLKTLTGK